MADVSLDDLIKKDKQKGKVDKLRQVSILPRRNSKAKNLLPELALLIVKTKVIGDKGRMSLKREDS